MDCRIQSESKKINMALNYKRNKIMEGHDWKGHENILKDTIIIPAPIYGCYTFHGKINMEYLCLDLEKYHLIISEHVLMTFMITFPYLHVCPCVSSS